MKVFVQNNVQNKLVGICKKTYRKRVMKIKEKYKLRKSSGPYINHVDKENLDAFGMSFGGATALNLTHASDLEPIRKIGNAC